MQACWCGPTIWGRTISQSTFLSVWKKGMVTFPLGLHIPQLSFSKCHCLSSGLELLAEYWIICKRWTLAQVSQVLITKCSISVWWYPRIHLCFTILSASNDLKRQLHQVILQPLSFFTMFYLSILHAFMVSIRHIIIVSAYWKQNKMLAVYTALLFVILK